MKVYIQIFIVSCLFLLSCKAKVAGPAAGEKEASPSGYTFQKPDASWDLPSSLNEISGIGLLNDSVMVCQEDENGLLYLYNLAGRRVERTISFGNSNDYEDLAIVGPDVYVLQSNGSVVQVANYLQKPVVSKFKTELTGKNDTEGLGYDPVSKALLITCKDKQDMAETPVNGKLIYAFSLQDKTILPKPFLVFEEPEFAPSALAVHPVDGNIYVLSSKKKRLIELSRDGAVINRYELKGGLFPQPEGLTILANGDMYISNEARGGSATILLFKNNK